MLLDGPLLLRAATVIIASQGLGRASQGGRGHSGRCL
jgi:hypothetical protein